MYKHQKGGGSKRPSVYSYKVGLVKKRRSALRYIIPAALLINGAVMLAIFQTGHRFDTSLRDEAPSLSSRIEQIPDPQPVADVSQKSQTIAYTDDSLQGFLNDWAAKHPGTDWSIVVKSLDKNGKMASVRGNSWYMPASLYKLLLTYDLFQHYDMQQLSTQTIYFGGTNHNLKTCLEAMIRNSDNPCGEAVAKQLGWAGIDASLRKVGLKETQLNRKDEMFSNANDVALYLEKMYNGQLFDKQTRDYLLGLMQQQRFRAGIPAGCKSCIVANKTGDNAVRHDAAIVSSKGHNYVLVIMTSGASNKQIAELTSQINDYMTK